MSLFSDTDLNKQRVSGGLGFPLAKGTYVLEVTETKAGSTRQKGGFFEFLFLVKESNNEDQKVGSIANDFSLISSDWGPAAIKRLLCLAIGLDPTSAKDAEAIAAEDVNKIAELAVSNPTVFKGRLINCTVVEKKNKAGTPTLYRNYSVNPETREKAQKALSAGKK